MHRQSVIGIYFGTDSYDQLRAAHNRTIPGIDNLSALYRPRSGGGRFVDHAPWPREIRGPGLINSSIENPVLRARIVAAHLDIFYWIFDK